MREMENIERKVDRILEAGGKPKRPMRYTKKLMGLPIGTVAMYLGVILVGAVLITAYTTYYGIMTGDIELTGTVTEIPMIKFDTTTLTEETTALPMDITDLTAGDIGYYTHILSCEHGQWDVTFLSNNQYTDPTHEFFGFYFDIQDGADNSLLDDTLVLIDEGTLPIEFRYELDPDFAPTPNPLPFDTELTFTAHTNLPPEAVYDGQNIIRNKNIYTDIYVLTNDNDPETHGLDITGVTYPPERGICQILGTYPSEYLHCLLNQDPNSCEFTYTISDGHGGTDTTVVELNYTP